MRHTALSEMFHEGTKLLCLEEGMEDAAGEVPVAWTTVHFKSYPRFKQLALPQNLSCSGACIDDVLATRRSKRDFNGEPISVEELSKMLRYSAGITTRTDEWDESRRAHPSAGARYPLESYLVVLAGNEIEPGIYHYHRKHSPEFRR